MSKKGGHNTPGAAELSEALVAELLREGPGDEVARARLSSGHGVRQCLPRNLALQCHLTTKQIKREKREESERLEYEEEGEEKA